MNLNPLKYMRFLCRVTRFWLKVRNLTNLSFWRQFIENYHLRRSNLMEPVEYYEKLELYGSRYDNTDKRTFMSRNQFALLCKALNPPKSVGLFDKYVFKLFALHHNLPVAEFYGLYDARFGFTTKREPLRTAQDLRRLIERAGITEFMLKPSAGWKGKGSMLGQINGDGSLQIAGQGQLTLEQVVEQMSGTHHSGNKLVDDSWIVEARVRQHSWFDRYTDSCTQTVRVVTYLAADGEVLALAAVMKISVAGNWVDSLGEVGMTAPLSDDGFMGTAVRDPFTGRLEYLDVHPETGAPIKGEQIPFYRDAVELALRAQSLIPHLRTIGWDIAITENGPVIIEGNTYWGWYMMQRGFPQGVLTGKLAGEMREIMSAVRTA